MKTDGGTPRQTHDPWDGMDARMIANKRGIGRRSNRRSALGSVAVIGISVSLCAAAAVPAAAQSDGPSILTLLPVTGTLSLGEEVSGRLRSSDYVSGGRRVQRHEFEGSMGDPLIIDLVSDDFDGYLIVIGPDGAQVASDDDSGGGCHARISLFLEQAGTFGVIAASLSGATGSFTLRLDNRQGPRAPGDCGGLGGDILDIVSGLEPAGTLSLSGTTEIQGELDETDAAEDGGGRLETWLLSGEPGQIVVVDLTSRAFDALLLAVEPDGLNYSSDDDSGGACNSRLEIRLEAAAHIIVVRSFDPSAAGAFTLRVSEEAGPTSDEACPDLP